MKAQLKKWNSSTGLTGQHYSIHNGTEKTYFLTSTVVDWIDVFTRKNHKNTIVESLQYCIKEKGLNVFAWCLMPSHLHIIANTRIGFDLVDTIRDFKQYTSKKVLHQIKNEPESRREWLLERFREAGKLNRKITNYKFWKDGNHAIEVYSERVIWQKINYIHQNPVKELFVQKPEEYLFSSARNYIEKEGLIDVVCLPKGSTFDASMRRF